MTTYQWDLLWAALISGRTISYQTNLQDMEIALMIALAKTVFTAQAELVWPIADSITTYLNAFLIVSVYYVLENVFPQLAYQLPR
jgi:hypothetical protein